MNPEYDFADEHDATIEKQADDPSTGDHEESDDDGFQGPSPLTEFKRLLEVWAKDFERMEAAIYQQTAVAETISAVEAKRLHDAVDAATTMAEASSVLIQQFIDQSGNPELPEIFKAIQMLLGARNDATRKSQRAKDAPGLQASKQGLAKDPAALTAANQTFATCEDKRTPYQYPGCKICTKPTLGAPEISERQHCSHTPQHYQRARTSGGIPSKPRPARIKDQTGGQCIQQRPH